MSLPASTDGYALGPDDGEALWFNRGLLVVKATVDQTGGKYAAVEVRGRKGFAAPLHIHRNEDEFFIVLSGEIRFQLGEQVTEGVAGTLVYGPRDIAHSFHVDSDEARLLLLFGPGGNEDFFRQAGKPARAFGFPPDDEEFPAPEQLRAIGERFASEFVGPPLPPKG